MKRIAFLLCLTVLLAGCNDKNDILEPLGRQSDTIKLSAKELLFDNTESKQSVTTEGDSWELDGTVYIDGKCIERNDPTLRIEMGNIDKFGSMPTPLSIEGEWFTITRELQRIDISVKANPMPKERTLHLYLSDRNYRGSLTIKQEGA